MLFNVNGKATVWHTPCCPSSHWENWIELRNNTLVEQPWVLYFTTKHDYMKEVLCVILKKVKRPPILYEWKGCWMVGGMLDEHKPLLQVIYIEQARVVTSQDLHSHWFWHLGRVSAKFLRSKLRASEVSSQSHVLENPKLGTGILHQK
jgi:hypothetical protein